ncbi:MAG: hypothetical protein V3V84_06660 [Candidatus Bathyarchaeia archaeon]
MKSRVAVLSFVFTLLLLAGVVGHIIPVQSQTFPGDILVLDPTAGTGGKGALFRVDPTSGERTLLSNFGVGANQGSGPQGVAVYPVIPAPVGGVVTPVNKLEILAPYLALAGLVAAVTAALTIKKRRKD